MLFLWAFERRQLRWLLFSYINESLWTRASGDLEGGDLLPSENKTKSWFPKQWILYKSWSVL